MGFGSPFDLLVYQEVLIEFIYCLFLQHVSRDVFLFESTAYSRNRIGSSKGSAGGFLLGAVED